MASTGDFQRRQDQLERGVGDIWEFLDTMIDIQNSHTVTLDKHTARFDALDARLDRMDKRFDLIDKQFDLVNQRFAQMFTFFGIPPAGQTQN